MTYGTHERLPVKVLSASSEGKDVTAEYADTQAQIQSLKAARARYLAILAKADTISETLSVQQRVDEVQGQIDRLEGQRRVLARVAGKERVYGHQLAEIIAMPPRMSSIPRTYTRETVSRKKTTPATGTSTKPSAANG